MVVSTGATKALDLDFVMPQHRDEAITRPLRVLGQQTYLVSVPETMAVPVTKQACNGILRGRDGIRQLILDKKHYRNGRRLTYRKAVAHLNTRTCSGSKDSLIAWRVRQLVEPMRATEGV